MKHWLKFLNVPAISRGRAGLCHCLHFPMSTTFVSLCSFVYLPIPPLLLHLHLVLVLRMQGKRFSKDFNAIWGKKWVRKDPIECSQVVISTPATTGTLLDEHFKQQKKVKASQHVRFAYDQNTWPKMYRTLVFF